MIRTRLNRFVANGFERLFDRAQSLERLALRHAEGHRLELELTKLLRRGLVIETVYDVGAHLGTWSSSVRRTLPQARFILFEANAEHAAELERIGDRVLIATLGAVEGDVEFFATGSSGDSYYREATANYERVAAERRRATTLDRLVAENELPLPDLIKLDVQGAELDVLRGGTDTLSQATLALLECPVLPYNEGAPTIDAYFRFMDERGFTVVEFLDRFWWAERLAHVDVLFASLEKAGTYLR